MMNHVFRKTMFLAVLLLLACLLCVSAQAEVRQTENTAESVKIEWDAPPKETEYYVQEKYFSDWVNNWLYYSNYNSEEVADGIFDDVRTEIPVNKVLSITVVWALDGEEKGRQVLNPDTRSYTITGLLSNSAYDVKITYKWETNDEKDGGLYNSPLGSMVAHTAPLKGMTVNHDLWTGYTYNASELSYGTYFVRDDSEDYLKWSEDSGKKTCTINMDQNLTVEEIELYDGATLVLIGSGTLTVKTSIWRDPRVSPGYLKIKDHVSVNSHGILVAGLTVDTTGKVTVKPNENTGSDYLINVDGHMLGTNGRSWIQRVSNGSLRIYNGTVSVTGTGSTAALIGCGELVMRGGKLTARNGDIGISTIGDIMVSAENGDVYISISARESAVQFNPLSDEYANLPPGDLMLDSPVVLTTPAGGYAKQEKNDDYSRKNIVNAGGDIAAQIVISVDPEAADPVKAFVRRCYKLILNRDADESGLNGWSDALQNKTAAASQIIDGFVRSEEYTNRNLSPGESVDVLYNAMLNRPADEGGKTGWVDALSKGYTLQHIINGFCTSDEFTGICEGYGIEPGTVDAGPVNPQDDEVIPDTPRGRIEAFVRRCYKLILNREPDTDGLKGWSDALEQRTAAAAQIIDGFVRSDEYTNRNLAAGESVDILYQTMLGRAADEGGKAGWVDALGQGYTLQHIINGFCGSAEFTAICDNYGIVAGSVAVSGAMVKREAITPEGEEAAPVVIGEYRSEYTNEEKIRAFVEHCYVSVFGREGDAEGVENYTRTILDGKKTPKKVAYEFIFSPEFQNNLPGNETFVRILYRLYFNREADAEGLAGWIQMIEGGATLDEIVNGFAASPEFRTIVNSMKE